MRKGTKVKLLKHKRAGYVGKVTGKDLFVFVELTHDDSGRRLKQPLPDGPYMESELEVIPQ